jgi:hypothetical protein
MLGTIIKIQEKLTLPILPITLQNISSSHHGPTGVPYAALVPELAP